MSKMPALFVGHGSPMNAIEDNSFTRCWVKLAEEIPRPKAILAISAHWNGEGIRVNDEPFPKTIYDMYGFPEELYKINYNCPGSPELARSIKERLSKDVIIDNSWGLDHGSWVVLKHMYPKCDIPVVQLSLDLSKDALTHFTLGKQLKALRDEGILILGSGNVVHNLSKVNFSMKGGYPWAADFDKYIKDNIVNKNYDKVINYKGAGDSAKLAFRTMEHFYPLLYILGATEEEDKVQVYNDTCNLGSLSMTSYLFK